MQVPCNTTHITHILTLKSSLPRLLRLQFGYTLFRRVIGYYSGEEDAYDMRKAMPRDVLQKSIVPLDRPIYPHELECD